MKTKSIEKLRTRLAPVKNSVIQKLLYLFYTAFRFHLNIKFISAPDLIVFSGNYFIMYWQITGCYKIIINDSIVLPGNTTKVHFDSNYTSGNLNIRFYGCVSIIEKNIAVNIINADLKKHLAFHETPNQFEPVLMNTSLKRFTVHKLKYLNPLSPIIPQLSISSLPLITKAASFLQFKSIPIPNIRLDQYSPEN